MKARILTLIDGKFLPQIKENATSDWGAADRSGRYIWGSRPHFHYGICETREQALATLAKYGVTQEEMT